MVTSKAANAVDAFLSHYGVRGMKWGVRKSGASTKKKKKSGPPPAKSLSDEQLRAAINRMQLERQYTDLAKSKGKGRVTKAGADFAKGLGGTLVKTAATSIATTQVNRALKKVSK